MNQPSFAGRDQAVVFGMHDQRGNFQLVTTDIQARDRYADISLDLPDKRCPGPGRHAQVPGKVAQHAEESSGGGNTDRHVGAQPPLQGEHHAGTAHGVPYHRLQRWQLCCRLKQRPSEQHYMRLMPR
ncbi:hypothetical protein D3C77_579780 [compost metagenome]